MTSLARKAQEEELAQPFDRDRFAARLEAIRKALKEEHESLDRLSAIGIDAPGTQSLLWILDSMVNRIEELARYTDTRNRGPE